MKAISLTCALMFSAISTVNAASLYVKPNGNGLDCSKSDPCGAIQTAVNLAAAGDKIKVAAGNYVENVTIPGGKAGLAIMGAGAKRTKLKSAGGTPGVFAPLVWQPISLLISSHQML